MRILFATDGSDHARVASALLRDMAWPDGAIIRVVAAVPTGTELLGLSWVTVSSEAVQHQGDDVRRHFDDIVDSTARGLMKPGLVVERLLLRGRPASAIVDEARQWPADLVVVGHRGRGAIGSMVLGSVSAEVVDHAPCPVLVVRRSKMASILFATDGSPSARHAEELLATWPMFGSTPIRVVDVATAPLPLGFGMAVEVGAEVMDAYAADAKRARAERIPVVEATAARLREAGRTATGEVLEGDPAATIVASVEACGEDLVVIGSRGHTGLARLLLGSVARNVLVHAPSSVLVVREHARVAPPPEPALAVELS